MRRIVLILPLLVAACNGSSSGQSSGSLEAQTRDLMRVAVEVGDGVEQALPAFLAPTLAAAKGITLTPGAAANSFTFHVPVDTDGNGTNDATVDGTVTLNGSLFTFGPGFSGTATVTIALADGRTLSADLGFRIAAGGAVEIWGTGSLTGSVGGTDLSFGIDQATPLVLTVLTASPLAGEAAVPVPNLCNYAGQGTVRVFAYGSDLRRYSALWTLGFDRKPIMVTEASVTGPDEETETPLPDSSFEVECPAETIQDWAGTYDFNWFCNPEEEGVSVLVITVTGPDTIHIVDGDLEYDATAVPGKPHVVQGFFIDGDIYREDFVWTLSPNGKTFTQQSFFRYLPPSTGGGVCGGGAVKRP